jgi:DNA invertase Pin-like site-specific DNA recombinase
MTRTAIACLRPLEAGECSEQAALSAGTRFEVVAVVRDPYGPRRSRLAEALERIAAGEASTLVVARLGALASSLRELVSMLDWLGAARADLVALDVGLDTGTAVGRRIVAVLREIERWEREPGPGRQPRGRPGLAIGARELSGRISEMRKRGVSLQAIADALNAERVPTPRGGVEWRPSSVQAALGYRRPRPPAPGVPPVPPTRPSAAPHALPPGPGGPAPRHPRQPPRPGAHG